MDEDQLAHLVAAASEFTSFSGVPAEASVKEFLDRYPLSLILSALQREADKADTVRVIVSCLEKIFRTNHGISLIPQNIEFVLMGLQANSEMVKQLACQVVSSFLAGIGEDGGMAVQLVWDYNIYSMLLKCLIDGNELVAAASMDAIKILARSPKGIDIIFPAYQDKNNHLGEVAARCSSMARIRILSLIVKLFSVSSIVASAVYDAGLFSLLEAEISSGHDMLTTLNAFELLYELAESSYGLKFLSRTKFMRLLASVISNASADSVLRSRAIVISGRLLNSDYVGVSDQSSVKDVLMAIDGRLIEIGEEDSDECECAVEALGEIGSYLPGAELLLSAPTPLARHVVQAAFSQQGRGKHMAALHALANICGEGRAEEHKLLSQNAEECLRDLIYVLAAKSSRLSPSGLFLSVMQQDADTRLAAYRAISGLVVRPWGLMEICSKQEIIEIVTTPHNGIAKQGMEAQYVCCIAISKAFFKSDMVNDLAFSGMARKLQEAVKRGPYLAKGSTGEARPIVITAERF